MRVLPGALAATTVLLLLGLAGVFQQNNEAVFLEQSDSGEEDKAIGTPFHFTKWGPLRSEKWQSSRYRVLSLWEAASRSLETCMNAVGLFRVWCWASLMACHLLALPRAALLTRLHNTRHPGGFYFPSCTRQQLHGHNQDFQWSA
jgi:hypothetical protein